MLALSIEIFLFAVMLSGLEMQSRKTNFQQFKYQIEALKSETLYIIFDLLKENVFDF